MRAARAVEVPQQGRVIRRGRGLHGGTFSEHGAPRGDFRQSAENSEFADAVEGIEIAEHRAEHRVDQAEAFAVEPRTFQPRFDAREFASQRRCLGVEATLPGP